MQMKQQNPDMVQYFSGALAAIHARPERTPRLVSHAVVSAAPPFRSRHPVDTEE
jgi:hypothetical protein